MGIWRSKNGKMKVSACCIYLYMSVMKGLAVWNLSSTCHDLTQQCSNQNKRKRGGKACYFTLKKVCGTRPSIKQFPLPLPVIQSILPLNNIVRHQNFMTRNSAHTHKLGLSDWKNMPSAVLLSSHVSVCVGLPVLPHHHCGWST